MKKDYHYYHKRSIVYAFITLTLLTMAVAPIMLRIHSTDVIVYIQLGLGLTSFIFFMYSKICGNKKNDIRRAERQQIKKKEFNEILTLTKEGKDDEAYDALCNYRDKYN